MGMGLALIGGALAGLGQGMTEVGKLNAMQRFEAWRDDLKAKRDADARTQTAALNDQNDANRQYRGAVYDKQNDERAAGAAVGVERVRNDGRLTVEKLEHANAVVIEGIKHSHRLTEDQTRIAKEEASALARAGKEVGEVKVTADGALAFYSKTGTRLGFTKAGGFVPPKSAEDDEPKTWRRRLPEPAAATESKPAADNGEPAPRAGQTASDGQGRRMYWNGQVWVPLTESTRAEQQRLLSSGK